MSLRLGNDPWHGGFSGDLKNVRVNLGPGAFRSENFNELYEPDMVEPEPVELTERTEPGEVINHGVGGFSAEFAVPEAELSSIDSEYAYAYWYRINYFVPSKVNIAHQRASWQTMSTLSEGTNN